jgi:hypothetical protein
MLRCPVLPGRGDADLRFRTAQRLAVSSPTGNVEQVLLSAFCCLPCYISPFDNVTIFSFSVAKENLSIQSSFYLCALYL